MKHFTKSRCIRLDLEKLKNPNIAEVFPAKVGGKFAALSVLDSNVDSLANSLKEGLLSAAGEVLGDRGRRFNLRLQTRFWICATRDGR